MKTMNSDSTNQKIKNYHRKIAKNALIAERQKFTDFEMRTLHPDQILKVKETNLFISNLNCLHNLGAKFA